LPSLPSLPSLFFFFFFFFFFFSLKKNDNNNNNNNKDIEVSIWSVLRGGEEGKKGQILIFFFLLEIIKIDTFNNLSKVTRKCRT